jgi:hypothetical protein
MLDSKPAAYPNRFQRFSLVCLRKEKESGSKRYPGSRSLKVSGDVAEQFGQNYSSQVSMAAYLKAGMTIVLEAPAP